MFDTAFGTAVTVVATERHLGAATARWLGGDGSRLCAVSLDLFVDDAEVRIDGGELWTLRTSDDVDELHRLVERATDRRTEEAERWFVSHFFTHGPVWEGRVRGEDRTDSETATTARFKRSPHGLPDSLTA
ncbi:MAG: hypothetical protein M3Q22_02675 [Actinomycetota bacterium]|nr:hypothetical protein [Actinomycetota bacterium]